MKLPECRVFFVCLVMVVLVAWPVQANPLPPPVNFHLYIEKDGIPYNESIDFSLNCYGHTTQIHFKTKYLRNKTRDDPDPPKEVFVTSGNCPSYGCSGNSYESWDPGTSELCQLNGTIKNDTFSIWNSSDKPVFKYFKTDQWPYSYYDYYFTLPSDKQTPEAMTRLTVTPSYLKSPVESLYCSILSIFGVRC